MKIYIGGCGTCSCHQEKESLIRLVNNYGKNNNIFLTDKLEDADLIVFIDTCVSAIETLGSILSVIRDFCVRRNLMLKC